MKNRTHVDTHCAREVRRPVN